MKKILSLLTSMAILGNATTVVVACDKELLEATNLTTWSSQKVDNSINLQQELSTVANKSLTTAYSFIGQKDPDKATNLKYQDILVATTAKNSFTNLVANIIANKLGKDVGDTKNWFTENSIDESINTSGGIKISNILAYFNYQLSIEGKLVDPKSPTVIQKNNKIHLVITFDPFGNFSNSNSNVVIVNKNTDKFTGTATFDVVADWL
ncbi:hypothetical protein [Spiroplasma eriocheiris]|uniref:Lipoprotein n=1 Tax=Spiroplasma eriocheiris TaxID=315358 RepID=A0A0H3XLX5_9MOLU|nr:hypothetical protein [Spiroplasma eriocheiris]AHF57376.1 hypothetical protein SPE_0243 [Spiroplasma eriocheiris CCTCC M 207170]AKM53832.1 hypothetical protein SERIO_v1c02460 [Spiroplasma eriocheiris]